MNQIHNFQTKYQNYRASIILANLIQLRMHFQIKHSSASYNNLIQKKKIKIPMEKHQTQCFICGNSSCEEDTDHQKMSYYQFDDLLMTKAGYDPQIVKLKHKIRKCFNLFEQTINSSLQPYINELFLMVDKLHFWHLMKFSNTLRDIQATIFGQILPRRQIIRLLELLNMEPDRNVKFPKFDRLLQEIHKFKKNGKRVIQKASYGELILKITQIIDQCEREFENDQSLRRQQNSLYSGNAGIPTLQQEQSLSQFVIIQGIPFSTLRKNIDFSVLELTDHLMLGYYSSLQKLRGLSELQIRNSRLSQRSYKMLFSCFPNLQSLDLSSSNSDNFFSVLGEKLPNLKTLYVNQTSLNDEKLQKMLGKMPHIRVLYADDNQISNEGIQSMFKNKKQIVYASVKGNNLTDQFALKLQLNLVFKGGYLEY